MRPNRSPSEEPRSVKPAENDLEDQDPGHRGLRILARMIARDYLEEGARKRLANMGLKPRVYVGTIKIATDCMDLNNPTERQKLHASIDKAIEAAELQGWRENSPPFVMKKDGLTITLKS